MFFYDMSAQFMYGKGLLYFDHSYHVKILKINKNYGV